MATPVTWVILVNYNGNEDTIECVCSLKATQTENVKILIVDNGSEKNDQDSIRVILDDQVEGLFLSENLGFGVANNKGVAYAVSKGAEYLLLLNNDTIVDNELFRVFFDYADANKIFVPAIYYFDHPSELWYAGGTISRWRGTSTHRTKLNSEGAVEFATGCCIFFHRSIVDRYGLFDKNYFMYYEDTDFSIKMQEYEVPIYYIPAARIWHKVGRSSGKINGLQEYYLQRNRLYLIYKYKRYFFVPMCMLYFIITRGLMFVTRLVRGKTLKHIVKAVLDFKKGRYGRQSIC